MASPGTDSFTAGNGARVVHQTRGRLRVKLPLIADPLIDFSWLQHRLERIEGVTAVRINRRACSLILHHDGEPATRARILAQLATLERGDLPTGAAAPQRRAERYGMLRTGLLLLAFPLLPPPLRAVLTVLNISPVLLEGADTLLRRGIKVEVLDAIALGLAASKGSYFATNVTYLLLQGASYLEQRTEYRSDTLLRQLLRPEPVLTWVERGGELVQVLDSELGVDERVVVGPGEKIPVDGLVLGGTALVNQSAITGESVPVRKEVMDRVVAGSLIEDGRLRIEARHVGDDTTTARIARFIEDSINEESDSQRLAERFADQRVYLTLGTGALVYLLTRDSRRLESVFLVDYSCALKMGTPLAFKSGMYRAATDGLLFKGAESIERLAAVDTVLFDKTGTLTESELEVTGVLVLDEANWGRERLLAVVSSIEEHASHPVAEAIVRKAREERLNHVDHGEVEYLVAHGMRCPVHGDQLLIGSRHFLEEHENIRFDAYEAQIEEMRAGGNSLLYIGTPAGAVGLIALRDTLREDAGRVITQLRQLGVRHIAMVTGDQRQRAEAMARELGIDEVFAEQHPEDKVEVLAQLQAEGRRVAFVGDGVNDGPVLSTADVGIAMCRGAELARATADVVLLEDRLSLLPEALEISQRTMRLVASNYRAAIGINTGVMLFAALGLLSPVVTAVLHNGTTVALLLKALRGIEPRNRPDAIAGSAVPHAVAEAQREHGVPALRAVG